MKCTVYSKEYTPENYFFHLIKTHGYEIELARAVVNGELVIPPEKRVSRG